MPSLPERLFREPDVMAHDFNPSRGRGRKISEFEGNLVYRACSRTTRATQTNPVLDSGSLPFKDTGWDELHQVLYSDWLVKTPEKVSVKHNPLKSKV